MILNWPKPDARHLMVSGEQMQKLEKKIFSKGMPVEALMEKVGIAIASWILDRQALIGNGVVVFVGPGHNGGDGLVVARELFLAGIEVSIWCPFSLKKDLTQRHFEYAKWIGINNLKQKPSLISGHLWIEALFGLNQSKAIPQDLLELLNLKKELDPNKLVD